MEVAIAILQNNWPFFLGLGVGNFAFNWYMYNDPIRGVCVGVLAVVICFLAFWALGHGV